MSEKKNVREREWMRKAMVERNNNWEGTIIEKENGYKENGCERKWWRKKVVLKIWLT